MAKGGPLLSYITLAITRLRVTKGGTPTPIAPKTFTGTFADTFSDTFDRRRVT